MWSRAGRPAAAESEPQRGPDLHADDRANDRRDTHPHRHRGTDDGPAIRYGGAKSDRRGQSRKHARDRLPGADGGFREYASAAHGDPDRA